MTIRYSAIAADIKVKLESLANIGIIHDYERQSVDLAKFIALFKDTSGRSVAALLRNIKPARYSVITRWFFEDTKGCRTQPPATASFKISAMTSVTCFVTPRPRRSLPGNIATAMNRLKPRRNWS